MRPLISANVVKPNFGQDDAVKDTSTHCLLLISTILFNPF